MQNVKTESGRVIPLPSEEEDAAILRGIEADPEARLLTAADFARMRPASESLPPEMWQKLTRHRGAQKEPVKERITIRLSKNVLARFRATGKGWQTRMDEVLQEWAAAHPQG
jgi:uncharacterized protein (DUF4415 family)